MKKICLFATAMLIISMHAVAADSEVKSACEADVKAFCADVKPGGGRIKACMKENKDKLSQGCKEALAKKHSEKEK